MQIIKYTNLELTVLNVLKEGSDCTSEIYMSNLLEERCMDAKKLRGVVASLIKKGAIDVDHDYDGYINIIDENFQGTTYRED